MNEIDSQRVATWPVRTADLERDIAAIARRERPGQRTAQAIADDLENRPDPLDPLDVRDTPNDFAEADAVIRSISVVRADDDGRPEVFASTPSEERSEIVALAGRAMESGLLASDRNNVLTSVAIPVRSPLSGAVVAAV